MNVPAAGTRSVVVRRTLKAPPSVIYRLWTDPTYAERWSWGSDYVTLSLRIDCRVGGQWRHRIRNRTSGEVWDFEGVFHAVEPNGRLVHTFHWRSDRGRKEEMSDVVIDFLDRGGGKTEVVITHTGLRDDGQEEKGTRDGWEDILACVDRLLADIASDSSHRSGRSPGQAEH